MPGRRPNHGGACGGADGPRRLRRHAAPRSRHRHRCPPARRPPRPARSARRPADRQPRRPAPGPGRAAGCACATPGAAGPPADPGLPRRPGRAGTPGLPRRPGLPGSRPPRPRRPGHHSGTGCGSTGACGGGRHPRRRPRGRPHQPARRFPASRPGGRTRSAGWPERVPWLAQAPSGSRAAGTPPAAAGTPPQARSGRLGSVPPRRLRPRRSHCFLCRTARSRAFGQSPVRLPGARVRSMPPGGGVPRRPRTPRGSTLST